MLGELLCAVVAHEACDGCARTGEYADDVADDPGADNGRGKYLLFLFREGDLIGELCGLGALLDLLLGEDEHLRHREETDQRARDVDALGEEGLTEHEALGAVNGVEADGGNKQTKRTGHEALDHGFARNTGNYGKAEYAEPELLRRHELQRELSQQRGEEIKRNAAEQAAPEGRPAGRRQRFTGLALQGHLVALDSRCGGSRGAGGMYKYGRDGAAKDSAAIDSAEDDKPSISRHGEGERQHQRNAHRGREAGQTADDDAERDAAHHGKEVDESESLNKALTHKSQCFKHRSHFLLKTECLREAARQGRERTQDK